MSDRLVWFLVGAGAIYLLTHQRTGVGAGGHISFDASFGGTGASTPPDQRWAQPTDATDAVQGVWDPMGAPTWYKLYEAGTSGNKVMNGGGTSA